MNFTIFAKLEKGDRMAGMKKLLGRPIFKNKAIAGLVIILAGGAGVSLYMKDSRGYVPAAFTEARNKGADASAEIVSISEQSTANLAAIQTDETKGDYLAGLKTILQEINQNNVARTDALALAKNLEVMTQNLNQVRPGAAANIGMEAIVDESQLVNHLINYNTDSYGLLELLRLRLEGDSSQATDAKIKSAIDSLNSETKQINDLNSKYQDLMSQFDNLAGA